MTTILSRLARKTPRSQFANPELTVEPPVTRGGLMLVASSDIEKFPAIVDELNAAMDVSKAKYRLPARLGNTAASAVVTRGFQRSTAAAAQPFAARGQTLTVADAMPQPDAR